MFALLVGFGCGEEEGIGAEGKLAWTGPGELVITEVMANPQACADAMGEWIEIQNVSNEDIALEGLVVGKSSTAMDMGIIASGHVLAPQERAVIATTTKYDCWIPAVGIVTSTVNLSNSGLELYLGWQAGEATEVTENVASMKVDIIDRTGTLPDAKAGVSVERIGDEWVDSTCAYPTSELATPGTAPCAGNETTALKYDFTETRDGLYNGDGEGSCIKSGDNLVLEGRGDTMDAAGFTSDQGEFDAVIDVSSSQPFFKYLSFNVPGANCGGVDAAAITGDLYLDGNAQGRVTVRVDSIQCSFDDRSIDEDFQRYGDENGDGFAHFAFNFACE